MFIRLLTPSFFVSAIILLSLTVKLASIHYVGFPLNDGGLFVSAANDMVRTSNPFPSHFSYNAQHIPFAYPPLAMQTLAALTALSHIPALILDRYLPTIFYTVACIFYYLLVSKIMRRRDIALIALGIYVFTFENYIWLIMGGGSRGHLASCLPSCRSTCIAVPSIPERCAIRAQADYSSD